MNFTYSKHRSLFAALLLLIAQWATAQITVEPPFPTVDDNITITYDATQGSRGLIDVTPVYVHTGVVTTVSAGQWTRVSSTWGTDAANVRMTDIGNNKHTLSFNIRSHYGVPQGEVVTKLAMVFRNVTGTREGKTATGGDIFYNVVNATTPLSTIIQQPVNNNFIANVGDRIRFRGAASQTGTLVLKDNGATLVTLTNARTMDTVIVVATGGTHNVEFTASAGGATSTSSFGYAVATPRVQALPAGTEVGANLTSTTSVTFRLDAPNKQNVFVIGSFNNWALDTAYLMRKTPDGRSWWLTVNGLTAGQTYLYQYLVDGTFRVADPLSTLVLDPNNDRFISAATYPNPIAYPADKTSGFVSVLKVGATPYAWTVNNFVRPAKSDLVIYELHVRDFVAAKNYQTLIDSINYLKNLRVNAIELMPIQEFDGNESWGYNPAFHNAIDKAYGTPEKLKEFVDLCHRNGIAVIVDVVFNHVTGNNPIASLYWNGATNQPAADNPYLNVVATHPFSVYNDMNHESQYTKDYMDRCLKFGLSEYRFDGYRFDLSKGFTQRNNPVDVGAWGNYDQSRVDILKRINTLMQTASPNSYVILEHLGVNAEETVLANDGMMLWGKTTDPYNELTMGYNNTNSNNIGSSAPQSRGWTSAANNYGLVGYMESHDEERLMFKNISFGNMSVATHNVRNLNTALGRQEMAAALFYAQPGPKMLWQFGELGYDVSIDFNGRTGNKPVRWEYFQDPNRKQLYRVTANMIAFHQLPALRSNNYAIADLQGGLKKHFHVSDPAMNVTVIANADVVAQDVVPFFQANGTWYNYLTGDQQSVTNTQAPIRLLPGEYRVFTSVRLAEPPAGYIRYGVGTKELEQYVERFQLYPNPTAKAQTTNVGFTLRETAKVRLTVTDALGRVVSQIAAQNYPVGSHEVAIEKALVSGVYFVRMDVNGATATQKLIVE